MRDGAVFILYQAWRLFLRFPFFQFHPHLKHAIWIGYSKPANQRYSAFAWVDGSCSNFSRWGCGEPNNNYWYGENCASIAIDPYHRNSGKFNDAWCGHSFHFVCEIDSPQSKFIATLPATNFFKLKIKSELFSLKTFSCVDKNKLHSLFCSRHLSRKQKKMVVEVFRFFKFLVKLKVFSCENIRKLQADRHCQE